MGRWIGRAVGAVLATVVATSAAGCDEDEPESAAAKKSSSTAGKAPSETSDEPAEDEPAASARSLPDSLPKGLLLSYAQFAVEGGKVQPKPGAARLELLYRQGGEWKTRVLEDPDSNVFHKAMMYAPRGQEPGILTLGGSDAMLKLWRPKKGGGFSATSLWTDDFGGKFNRMRDAEVADLDGDGAPEIAVGTHDQGVVAIVSQSDEGFAVERIDERKDTFIHEIEVGDLDGDDILEVYATPSDPNTLEGDEEQHGEVVRYVPKKDEGRKVVADLGNRHAKEIYVGDVDGDGRDELYVAVEALTKREGDTVTIVEPVEIRRYDADTPPDQGQVIATLDDRLTRFLTVGDVDGDGKKEMVAAAFKSGLWLLEPGTDPRGEWGKQNIDRESSGFEHASLITDLDGKGSAELYVAADDQGELRRYVWVNGRPRRETIHSRDLPSQMLTWNLMPFPVDFLASADASESAEQ